MKRKHFDLYKIFIYVALISLAISIIIPVSWVFLASIKTNAEVYGNPWALPQGFNKLHCCANLLNVEWLG